MDAIKNKHFRRGTSSGVDRTRPTRAPPPAPPISIVACGTTNEPRPSRHSQTTLRSSPPPNFRFEDAFLMPGPFEPQLEPQVRVRSRDVPRRTILTWGRPKGSKPMTGGGRRPPFPPRGADSREGRSPRKEAPDPPPTSSPRWQFEHRVLRRQRPPATAGAPPAFLPACWCSVASRAIPVLPLDHRTTDKERFCYWNVGTTEPSSLLL